jgi:hypothetical protein
MQASHKIAEQLYKEKQQAGADAAGATGPKAQQTASTNKDGSINTEAQEG